MKPILKTCGIHSTINRRVRLILVATGLPVGPGHQGHACQVPQFVIPRKRVSKRDMGLETSGKKREAGNEVEYTLRRVA